MASQPQPPPNANGQEEEYEVEKVIRKAKGSDGKPLYLIKWMGYSEDENTWEPEEHLSPGLVTAFHKREAGKLRGNRQMRTGTLPTEQMEMTDDSDEDEGVELRNVNEPVLNPTGVAKAKFPDAVMKLNEEKYDCAPSRNAKFSCIIL
ncbi:unnamed protein product [Orchesella dallaii]|uniref:Chromo domain-containing protein n=1 Tax=Orchesella dallaii TaxID=48710 RepID=A0ABP1QLN9_9HEXA